MGVGFLHGNGGSNPLNFKVVGNPKPSNPKENTIWLNTDMPIHRYVFSASSPEKMGLGIDQTVSGNIIKLDNASDGKFKGIKLYGKTTQNGVPSPTVPVAPESAGDKGTIRTTVCGKNLFDISTAVASNTNSVFEVDGNTIRIYSKSNSGTFHGIRSGSILMRKGMTYTLTVRVDAYTSGSIAFGFRKSVGNSFVSGPTVSNITEPGSYSTTYTPKEDMDVYVSIVVTGSAAGVMGDATFSGIQLEIGSAATTYEPYCGSFVTVQTYGGLMGIPVASGGNHTDANGEQWWCDHVDFEQKKIIRRIRKHNTANNSSATRSSYANPNGTVFYFGISSKYCNVTNRCLCTTRAVNTSTDLSTLLPGQLMLRKNNEGFYNGYVVLSTDDKAEALAAIKAEAMDIYYVSNTDEETLLSEEELAQYAALHTNYPSTTIFNDAGAEMEVKYVSNLETGEVCIVTGTYSNAEFNVLKKNGIYVSPLFAQQWDGLEWKTIDSESYKNGMWTRWWDGTLYDKGNEYTEVTGGWTGHTFGSSECEVTKNTESIYVKAYGFEPCVVYTEERIDLSKHRTLSLNVTGRTDNNGELSYQLVVSKENGEAMYSNKVAEAVGSTTGEISLDISTLTEGEYYIGVYLSDTGGGYEHSVTFDRVKLIA